MQDPCETLISAVMLLQEVELEVLARVLDGAMQPTAEYVADLESRAAAMVTELAAFREAAAALKEADGKVI